MRLSQRSKKNSCQHSIFFLSAMLIVILAGCSNEELSNKEINTLDPQKAAEFAANIEEEVPVELAEGFGLNLWASEELISDPVGLDVDNKGRLFVTNTTRSWSSEFDIRNHRDWMDEAMTCSTVEDRSFASRARARTK